MRMWIFGKKANQQSESSDVPPELRPYYGTPSMGTRLRRASLFVLPVLAAIVLIVALIAGGLWIRHRMEQDDSSVATSQSSQSQNQTQQPTTTDNTQSDNSSDSQSQSSAPSTDATSNSTSPSSGVTQTPDATSQTTTPASDLTNTGPDDGVYVLAFAAAVTATALAYIRQLKLARR